jgi:hypothetical protein
MNGVLIGDSREPSVSLERSMDAGEFRDMLRTRSPEDIVNELIISSETGAYTNRKELDFIENSIRDKFKLKKDTNLKAVVVGSAKLGFAIHNKRLRDGTVKSAFRSYVSGESDIDVAIVSPSLYMIIWNDLARHGSQQSNFPWITKLGNYMFHGWIRPDQFPNPGPASCSDWNNLFRELNREEPYQYKKFRYAIYASDMFLYLYHLRGIKSAKAAEYLK